MSTLTYADSSGANLIGADLRGAFYLNTDVRGADFHGADLSGSLSLINAIGDDASFYGDATNFEGSSFDPDDAG